jgi:hypothetical protein
MPIAPETMTDAEYYGLVGCHCTYTFDARDQLWHLQGRTAPSCPVHSA